MFCGYLVWNCASCFIFGRKSGIPRHDFSLLAFACRLKNMFICFIHLLLYDGVWWKFYRACKHTEASKSSECSLHAWRSHKYALFYVLWISNTHRDATDDLMHPVRRLVLPLNQRDIFLSTTPHTHTRLSFIHESFHSQLSSINAQDVSSRVFAAVTERLCSPARSLCNATRTETVDFGRDNLNMLTSSRAALHPSSSSSFCLLILTGKCRWYMAASLVWFQPLPPHSLTMFSVCLFTISCEWKQKCSPHSDKQFESVL